MKIAVLGAPGCVGANLIRRLLEHKTYRICGSFRYEREVPADLVDERLTWRQVDLLDRGSAESFLRGADVLIYLIHSLGARDFEQLDIRLADTAGSACKNAGVRKIIYLGGIVPSDGEASPHLISRMKTGQTLASFGIPVGEVRASILLETCSMSYLIVYHLARRLPLMITPAWLNSLCAPIGLSDAASCLSALIEREIAGHEVFEIGSEVIRYKDLIALCGKSIRGVRNTIITVPFFAIRLSALWIELITGVPNTVALALAEGLRTNTIPSNNRFREITGREPVPVEELLQELAEKMGRKT